MWDPDSEAIQNLQAELGYTFQSKALLRQSLTHDSLPPPTYQRLEFLGDAVIQFVVTDYLYGKYPNDTEGALTQKRIEMVSGKRQLEIANKLNLPKLVLMSGGDNGQPEDGKFKRWDKFVESLLGAIYLDAGHAGGGGQGHEAASQVVIKVWELTA